MTRPLGGGNIRVGILPGLNWFYPARSVKPGLNQIKLGLSGQNWVQLNNLPYVSSTFLPFDHVCIKKCIALYLYSSNYETTDIKSQKRMLLQKL